VYVLPGDSTDRTDDVAPFGTITQIVASTVAVMVAVTR
jgi:hypothetical protein